MTHLIDTLCKNGTLEKHEFIELLDSRTPEIDACLAEKAREITRAQFGTEVYVRGLIEFTNNCKNDCYYCGIRRSNDKAARYRLTKEEILSCCENGHQLGFRTFVLQGGEDGAFTDEVLVDIIESMAQNFPDCAVTLSLGEKTRAQYEKYFAAGAHRYLLRHETAEAAHYASLHPDNLTLASRKQCLYDLKDIGYQVGCGLMVGSPHQTTACLADDLLFVKAFDPEMVGIGPFIPHRDTPFRDFPAGSVDLTLALLSIVRIMLPKVLLPATTALGTLDPKGREKGVLSGCNVLMPNLSPVGVRTKYELYNDKICMDEEAAECNVCLRGRMASIGYHIADKRGDHPDYIPAGAAV